MAAQTPEGMDDGQYPNTPEGSAKRWQAEFRAADEALRDWQEAAEKCDGHYLDEKRETDSGQRLNLYAAGVDLKEATLYGNTPAVDVSRRNNDQNDPVGRVSAEMLKRMLNGDLERVEEKFPRAIGLALKDWLIPALGNVWLRLEREEDQVAEQPAKMGPDGAELAPAVPATTQLVREEVESDYVYWKDQKWSPCRVFDECRWWTRRKLLSRASFRKQFGDDEDVPLAIGADPKDSRIPKTPWARVELWEIWDKENACVWWYVEGHSRVLVPLKLDGHANPDGSIPDPLGISGFWPFPEPLIEGASNSKLVPRPSYTRAQDLYAGIDDTYSRERLLRNAIDASCVYDKTVGEMAGLLDSRGENKAVAAENYAALAEKGGIAACITWKPIDVFIAALDKLRDVRREDIELLFQVDGTSDIMRGQATGGGATATEQAIKAKYGSIRGGRAQKRFATFVSDAQRIRAEIICKHFSPETILARSNAKALPQEDQPLVQQAIQLLQSDFEKFSVVVKAESVSLTDFAANKQESLDSIQMIGSFIQAVGPLMQSVPQLAPKFLELLLVFIARVKGGDSAEPILESIIQQAQQMAAQAAQQPPQPNPQAQIAQSKVQTEQVKAGAEQFRAKADVAKTVLEMHAAQQQHGIDMQQLEAQTRADAIKSLDGLENNA